MADAIREPAVTPGGLADAVDHGQGRESRQFLAAFGSDATRAGLRRAARPMQADAEGPGARAEEKTASATPTKKPSGQFVW